MNDTPKIQLVCPSCAALNRLPIDKVDSKGHCGKCKNPLIADGPVNVSDATFSRFADKNDLPVVVDFWATWCGPCQQFAPVYAQVAKEMAGKATFVKLDTEANQQTAGQYAIRSIPTLMIVHHGKEVARLAGALPKQQFEQWLQQNLPTR